MRSVQNSYSEGLILQCLNQLEKVKNKHTKTTGVGSEVNQVIRGLKEYLLTVRINKDVFDEMQKEISTLRKEKEAIFSHHQQTLQNLEMLLYLNDYQQLKRRLSEFKAWQLPQSHQIPSKKQDPSLSDSKLDRAFVLEDEENEFLECVQISQKENSPIRETLLIMNSPPMQKKSEVMMEIMFSKNSEEDRPKYEAKKRTHQLSDFSQINPTQDYEAQFRHNDRHFSGKKVKSMILLKEKGKKANSKQKTSAKKQQDGNNKEQENAESHSKVKKRMLFPIKAAEESGKKKMMKQCEINPVRSFRKTIINNL